VGQSETFEHTADLGLRVVARDLAELFQTAAEGLFDLIVANRFDVEPREQERVALAAVSVEDLYLAWLNELIFRCETGHRIYRSCEVQLDDQGRALDATIWGEPIDTDRHILDHEVKAATRHGLLVRQANDGWSAEIILDI